MAESTVRPKEFGSDHGLIHEAVVTGRKAGASEAFWAKLAHDKNLELWPQVIEAVQGKMSTGTTGSCTLTEAAQIMGDNFHGPAKVKKHLDIKLSRAKQWQKVPFGAETLRTVASTHVLVAVPEVSIMDVHAKASQDFYSVADPWYGESRQTFAHEKCEPGWYLVRKDEVPDSPGKSYAIQQVLVQEPDFVPEANLAVYAWILHYRATGERLFSRVWVRTDSVTANGNRVRLGGAPDGLYVSNWRDDANSDFGVASARKSS